MNKFAIWTEYHMDVLLSDLEFEEWELTQKLWKAKTEAQKTKIEDELKKLKEKHKEIIKEELFKLDYLYEVLANSDYSHKRAENIVYGKLIGNFYLTCGKLQKKYEKMDREEKRAKKKEEAEERANREALVKTKADEAKTTEGQEEEEEIEEEPMEEPEKPPEVKAQLGGENLYLEKGLTAIQKELLFAKGFRRVKTSPFGNSGSAYYWVNPRYNESKEHAFFCYIIESELRKYTKEIEMRVTYGPDIIFKHKAKKYCFDVETGKNLTRHPDELEAKFSNYKKWHEISFIFITDKKFKYKYSKFGTVVTRGKLKETIDKLFA